MAFVNSRAHSRIFKFDAMKTLCTIIAIFFSINSGVVSQNSENACGRGESITDYKLVCYYNYWSNYYPSDGKFQVEYIDPCLCTHLVYAYVGISSCSDVLILDPQLQGGVSHKGREDFKRFIGLKKENPELKCLVAFGGSKGNHERFYRIIQDNEERRKFISNVMMFMDDYCLDKVTCFDGVSLDYYYPTRKSSEVDRNNHKFVEFLEEMRRMFTEHYEGEYKIIAVAVSANIEDYYDIPGIFKAADFVSLLAYDYYEPTGSHNKTEYIAPLYGRKLPNGQDTVNQNATVHAWLNPKIGAVDRKKLILGMPTYGRSFKLAKDDTIYVGYDTKKPAPTIGPYTNTPGYFTYNELVTVIYQNQGYNWVPSWDVKQEVPYAYQSPDPHKGSTGIWISHEDNHSFEIKGYYIKQMNLGGAMVNSIDADDFISESRYPVIQGVRKALLDNATSTASPITSTTPSPGVKKLVCYYASWAYYREGDSKFTPEDIDRYLCTHIISSSAEVGPDGGIKIMDPHLSLDLGDFTKFLDLRADNPELKLLVGIGGSGEKSEMFSKVVASSQSRKFFIDSVVKFLKMHSFDGINLDWMYPEAKDKDNYGALLRELRQHQEFSYHRILSIVGIPWDGANGYKIEEINKYVDFVNLWSFDYHGSWDDYTGLLAPLYRSSADSSPHNVNSSVSMWLDKGIKASKLIVGIPTYGRPFILQNVSVTGIGSPTVPVAIHRIPLTLGQNELVKDQFKWSTWKFHFDSEAKAAYGYGGNLWISYEDETSLGQKTMYINQKGLGGAMIYSLDTDDFHGLNSHHHKKFFLTFTVSKGLLEANRRENDPQNDVVCTKSGQLIKDRRSCSLFYSCQEKADGSFNEILNYCPAGLGFDESTQQCDYLKNILRCLECTRPGQLIKDPSDCILFYSCQEKADGSYLQVRQYCSQGLGFNERTEQCDYKENIPGCSHNVCTKPGQLVKDPLNCSHFYSCTEKSDGSYGNVLQHCPGDLGFNEIKQECDYKVNIPGCKENKF